MEDPEASRPTSPSSNGHRRPLEPIPSPFRPAVGGGATETFGFVRESTGPILPREEQLKRESARLQLEKDVALKENLLLLEENKRLRTENITIKGRGTELANELDKVTSRQESLQTENDRLGVAITLLTREVEQQKRTIQQLRVEASSRRTTNGPDRGGPRDSKGYYKILGIDPDDATSLSPEKFEKMLRSIWRAKSHAYHPDTERGDAARQVAINEAYEFLKYPNRRRGYL